MKKLCIPILVAAITVTSLTGCAIGNTSIASESNATIEQKIVKGKTTKADLRVAFGEPSEIGTNDGKEYWAYQMSQTSGVGMIPFVKIVTGSSGITGKYLRISFDKKGVVESYSLSETKL
ncbi:hypothetical protein HSX11_18675 [Oxalobacteraceae bacterium]|nr:hypothetical protein [Oxalobacteraceae bacterium]